MGLLAERADAELVTTAARTEELQPTLVLERDRTLSIDRHAAARVDGDRVFTE